VLVALVWGTTFVVVKRALDQISTFYFLATRFGLAAICMSLLFVPAMSRAGWRETRRGLLGGTIAGLFLWSGYVLQTFGLKFTSAGNSGFITGFYIVLVPLVAAMIYRRLPGAREAAGIVIATAGMAFLSVPSLTANAAINFGDLLTAGCALAFAFHLLMLGYYAQREQVQAVALGQVACTALLSTGALLFEPPRAIWSPEVLFGVVSTGVFATAIAFALQTWGQKHTTPTRTALIFTLEPVFALVTAVLIGGEQLTRARIIGCCLILTGILAVELKPPPRT
jgi:drug/metabolite transporter (DMT)-like permease